MQINHNAFSENLGNDVLAVDAQGNIVGRASSREAAEKAAPGMTYVTFADIDQPAPFVQAAPVAAAPSPAPNVSVSPAVTDVPPTPTGPSLRKPAVPTTPGGLPISDVKADDPTPEPGTRTHPLDDGTVFQGPGPADLVGADETVMGKFLDEHDAASRATLPADKVAGKPKNEPKVNTAAKVADGSKFDHDNDGKTGGSRPRAPSFRK